MEQIDTPRKIMDFRKRMGWSQKQLADRLGVDQSTVSRMERGAMPITRRTQQTLALLAERQEKPG